MLRLLRDYGLGELDQVIEKQNTSFGVKNLMLRRRLHLYEKDLMVSDAHTVFALCSLIFWSSLKELSRCGPGLTHDC